MGTWDRLRPGLCFLMTIVVHSSFCLCEQDHYACLCSGSLSVLHPSCQGTWLSPNAIDKLPSDHAHSSKFQTSTQHFPTFFPISSSYLKLCGRVQLSLSTINTQQVRVIRCHTPDHLEISILLIICQCVY